MGAKLQLWGPSLLLSTLASSLDAHYCIGVVAALELVLPLRVLLH